MPCVIELTGIRKSFGGVHALKGVDFSISPGEVHCLVGENGSGKSTLIKIMSGVHEPDSGEIRIDGTLRARLTPSASIAAGVQVIYQDLSLFPNLSVAENIGIRQYMEKGRRLVDWRRLRKSADDAMRRIGVSLDPDRPVRELSIADRQLVAICRAIGKGAGRISGADTIVIGLPARQAAGRRAVSAAIASSRSWRSNGFAMWPFMPAARQAA